MVSLYAGGPVVPKDSPQARANAAAARAGLYPMARGSMPGISATQQGFLESPRVIIGHFGDRATEPFRAASLRILQVRLTPRVTQFGVIARFLFPATSDVTRLIKSVR